MKKKDYIFLKKKKGFLIKILHNDISHIEAAYDYCTIFGIEETHIIHITLSELVDKLPSDTFIRCHRSYIVNFDRITSVQGNVAYVGSRSVPIGDKYRKAFIKRLNCI